MALDKLKMANGNDREDSKLQLERLQVTNRRKMAGK
jgi:hypothetical protein